MKENQEFRQITLDEWLYWKEDIRDKLRETAGNFVYIGYRLKQIRDSGMYDGAADIFEFAQREYGLGKSTVSRFIAINEKFSEGGNSLELKAEYRDIGSSKLAEMLTLPDAECSLITERTTVKEIRELKGFLRQQPSEETGDADAAGEEEYDVPAGNNEEKCDGREKTEPEYADSGETSEMTPLEKCFVEYFRDKKDLLNDMIPLIYANRYDRAAELMNPSGYSTYKKGLVFLFLYDFSQGIKYKVFGQPEVSGLSWEKFLLQIYEIYGNLYEAGEEDIHGIYYREPEKEMCTAPGKELSESPDKASASESEKALFQDSKNTGEPSKVLDSEPSVATSQQKGETEKRTPAGTDSCIEEQLPGQMKTEDYPELLPESSYEEIEESGSRNEKAQENQEGNAEEKKNVSVKSDSGDSEKNDENPEPDGDTEEPESISESKSEAKGADAGLGEEPGGGQVPEPAAGHGAAQGDGCAADPWTEIKKQGYEEVWEELAKAEKGLSKFIWSWKGMDPSAFPRENLEEAYQDAVDLAAALEKLMIVRDANGEVDNA